MILSLYIFTSLSFVGRFYLRIIKVYVKERNTKGQESPWSSRRARCVELGGKASGITAPARVLRLTCSFNAIGIVADDLGLRKGKKLFFRRTTFTPHLTPSTPACYGRVRTHARLRQMNAIKAGHVPRGWESSITTRAGRVTSLPSRSALWPLFEHLYPVLNKVTGEY